MTTEDCTTATGSQFLTSVGDFQPSYQICLREKDGLAVVANTSGLLRFSILFLRISQCLKCFNSPYILFS